MREKRDSHIFPQDPFTGSEFPHTSDTASDACIGGFYIYVRNVHGIGRLGVFNPSSVVYWMQTPIQPVPRGVPS